MYVLKAPLLLSSKSNDPQKVAVKFYCCCKAQK